MSSKVRNSLKYHLFFMRLCLFDTNNVDVIWTIFLLISKTVILFLPLKHCNKRQSVVRFALPGFRTC